MNFLNRDVQRTILLGLAAQYPELCEPHDLGFEADDKAWFVNTAYLRELQLIEGPRMGTFGGPDRMELAKITARGLDFLQEDGGISAALATVTVRLDANTLRALIESRIAAADMPEPEKSKLMQWVRSAGAETMKEATQRLVQAALDQAPNALQLLQTLLDQK